MSEEKQQSKEQRKSLLSQRFGERGSETSGRKRGRPPAKVYRKNASFFLQPEVIAELDQAYHRLNVELAGKPKVDKATFREAILRKGIANLAEIRDELRP